MTDLASAAGSASSGTAWIMALTSSAAASMEVTCVVDRGVCVCVCEAGMQSLRRGAVLCQ